MVKVKLKSNTLPLAVFFPFDGHKIGRCEKDGHFWPFSLVPHIVQGLQKSLGPLDTLFKWFSSLKPPREVAGHERFCLSVQ
jgi:hypothetical protein